MIIIGACFVIFLWSLWAILCHTYNDGIIGKVILAGFSITAFAVLLGAPNGPAVRMMTVCLACWAVRDFSLRHARRFGIERRSRIDPLRRAGQ